MASTESKENPLSLKNERNEESILFADDTRNVTHRIKC